MIKLLDSVRIQGISKYNKDILNKPISNIKVNVQNLKLIPLKLEKKHHYKRQKSNSNLNNTII